MKNTDSFKQFLQEKKKEGDQLDWEKQKTDWLNSIEKLYKNIKTWLKPFEKEGLVEFTEKEEQLSEEYIGIYNAVRLDILIGKQKIRLVPKGTMVLGSYGRIDMEGPKGGLMIIKPELNSDKWEFARRTRNIVPGIPYSTPEKLPVTEETFKQIIQELV